VLNLFSDSGLQPVHEGSVTALVSPASQFVPSRSGRRRELVGDDHRAFAGDQRAVLDRFSQFLGELRP
jgi:hypothetical protein